MEPHRAAHTVLLPTIDGLAMPQWLPALLASGTRSILLAESREEYVARGMSALRQSTETAEAFVSVTEQIRLEAGTQTLVALDQEPWGIQRLHRLVPPLPLCTAGTTASELEAAAFEVATVARSLGVNVFLSPVVDRLSGTNPWLQGRTLSLPSYDLGRLGAAFVSGVQRAGVAAVVKHFPGFPDMTADPAVDLAHVPAGAHTPEGLLPFRMSIDAGALAVMTGPAPVLDLDPDEPASTSARVIELLRRDLGFRGLVISDDLDAPATLNGRTVGATAVAAIRAGAELLLLPGGPHVTEVAHALAAEAHRAPEFAALLDTAASDVDRLIATLGIL